MHCAFMLLPCLIGASIHIFYGLPKTAKDFDKKLYSNMWQAKKTRKCLASCKKRSKSFQLQTDIEMQ